jgi:hypothetical protein
MTDRFSNLPVPGCRLSQSNPSATSDGLTVSEVWYIWSSCIPSNRQFWVVVHGGCVASCRAPESDFVVHA